MNNNTIQDDDNIESLMTLWQLAERDIGDISNNNEDGGHTDDTSSTIQDDDGDNDYISSGDGKHWHLRDRNSLFAAVGKWNTYYYKRGLRSTNPLHPLDYDTNTGITNY